MAPNLPENGVDGDDEREEEDEEDEEDSEEDGEEEEEEEPRLKYQRMQGDLQTLLEKDSASCIAVADRAIGLGTQSGKVYILDFLGNKIQGFPAHTSVVNDLCFDIEGEYIGSCSDDGTVVINNLFSDETLKFTYRRAMKTIALDPEYARKSSRRFVTGGVAGDLYFNVKKWIGYRDQLLHSGEGPIHAVKWRGNLIAWANKAGVKVYDAVNDQRITFIEKPRGSPPLELLQAHLVWQDDTLLVIGWGTSVRIASIRTKQDNGVNGVSGHIRMSGINQVDIVASFQTSYFISGLAPFGDSLVVLAYIPAEDDRNKDVSSISSRQGTAQRPEVRVVTWNSDELATDALPIFGYEHYKAQDYSLAHAPFSGSSYAGGQWAAGDEPLYYIVSPKDIVIAKPRDAEDHIAWLLEHEYHEKALAAVEAGQGRSELLDEVGLRYLDHLIVGRKYAEAASLCPKLLRGSASLWERWVFHFAHLRQLPVLVPYIPIENPRLRDTVYEVALVSLATNPAFHKDLLSTVKSWPAVIYSALPVISAIEPQLNTSSMTDALKEALAELYVIDHQYEKAFALYADLMKPEVFDFIEKHNLHDAILEKIVQLMMIDSKHTTALLIQHRDQIPPPEVVSVILSARKNCDFRYFLHLYLHLLFEANPHAGRDYQDMQVELYAEYDPKMLLPFLRSSQHYSLEKAYDICVKRELLREQVFILGRMGNAKQALAVIINKLGDIEEAIEFVTMQHDEDLWEELIRQCFHKPELIGVLLEHTVGNLDPLHIVSMLPGGLEIPRLRDCLVKIITDYRTETSLRHGCNDILKADCVNLLVKYHKEAKRAIYLSNEENEIRAKRDESRTTQMGERTVSLRYAEVKSKTRGSGRCCMCFDPFPIQKEAVIVFFCCHAYHTTCLEDSINSVSSKKETSKPSPKEEDSYYKYENGGADGSEEEEDVSSAAPQMRCILCTTAAG